MDIQASMVEPPTADWIRPMGGAPGRGFDVQLQLVHSLTSTILITNAILELLLCVCPTISHNARLCVVGDHTHITCT